MLKDITLGQYFPVESLLHRLDPRTKIILVICYIVSIFLANDVYTYLVLAAFTFGVIALSKVPVKLYFRGLKPLWLILLFTAAINLFLTSGTYIGGRPFLWGIGITWEGLFLAIKMALRLILLILGSSVLTYTTSPIALTDGIEKLLSPFARMGLPAHELAMMMSIAIRFIPTLIEETEKIVKAQEARGACFDHGNVVRRAKALVPMLVPLFISAFRRADDLAVAMEARCYRGGTGRTRMKQIRFSAMDLYACLVFVAYLGVLITCKVVV